jgi:hypothetical protein
MDAESYAVELLKILSTHSEQAINTLTAVDNILPAKVSGIMIGVHPNQEPDGMFSILLHLDGPDLHTLNKAIDSYRYLFDVKFIDSKITPEVPVFDPFNTEFEVNDVIVDTALTWLELVWATFDGDMKRLPVEVFGDEGYGTKTPKKLTA